MNAGPLSGSRILELAGKGPIAQCASLLGDLGADVIRLDRIPPGTLTGSEHHSQHTAEQPDWRRGRRSVAVDLKTDAGRDLALALTEEADALIEGYRPGVAERLGLGPADCLQRNPRLVFGRVTGWGQAGPRAAAVGHDINYLAASGALAAIGRAGAPPSIPLNLVGDGAGGLMLAVGVLSAVLQARDSGRGQVVDVSMLDTASNLMSRVYAGYAAGSWNLARGSNYIDSGAPFYDVYRCADDRYVAVGAIEAEYFAALLDGLGIDPDAFGGQWDRALWPGQAARLTEVFAARSRDEWCAVFAAVNACVSPVLTLDEAPNHEINAERDSFVKLDGQWMPSVTPRFSGTAGTIRYIRVPPGAHTREALLDWQVSPAEIDTLLASGVLAQASEQPGLSL